MAAQSLNLARGKSGMTISDFGTGTNAPGTGDFELRWNTTDGNSKNILRQDVILACYAFIRALQQGGATVDVIALAGGSPPPPIV